MTRCFAVNCYTKSESGNKLFLIPQGQRNAERRKIWLERMGRKEEETFQTSRLCEFHFTPDQFEWNRQDGVFKLKPSAVPTIFYPRPAKDERWKRRKQIAVEEPAFIKCEPGLKPDTSASSSSNRPPGNLVKVEPEEILGLSNDEGNSTEVEEFPFQDMKAEPITDDCEARETSLDGNPIFMASSSSDGQFDESSKSVTGELTDDDNESDMQDVVIRNIKKRNGEIAKVLVKRKLKCPSCSKAFPYPSDLRRHVLIHVTLRKKIYKCASCVMSFTNRSELKKHLASHKDLRSCKFCDKLFTDQSTLKQHAKIHTGQKPYKCSCGKAFKRKNNFKRHQVDHAEAQPYCCICCTKSFPLRCELEVHMKGHSRRKINCKNVE